MEIICKLGINNTTKLGILHSASKDTSIKFAGQCIHILNNKDKLNELKGSTKIKNK